MRGGGRRQSANSHVSRLKFSMPSRDALKLVDRACPGCGGTARADAHTFTDHSVVRCTACGFVYLPVAVDPSVFASGDLAWENASDIKTARQRKAKPLRARLDAATRFRTKFAKKTPFDYLRAAFKGKTELPRIVDVGCGAGHYLETAAGGFIPFGIDISAALARVAKEKFARRGGDVLNLSSLEGLAAFQAGSMDAVILRSYLEHESEPKPLLAMSHRVLGEGGLVVVKVPNYASLNRRVMGNGWCGFRYPEHVNYFTPASLGRMARETGFTMRQSFFDALPTSDNMWAVLTKA